jgi:hypothetical protein
LNGEFSDTAAQAKIVIDILDVNDNQPVWSYPVMPGQGVNQPRGTKDMYIGAVARESKPDSLVLMPRTPTARYPGNVYVSSWTEQAILSR